MGKSTAMKAADSAPIQDLRCSQIFTSTYIRTNDPDSLFHGFSPPSPFSSLRAVSLDGSLISLRTQIRWVTGVDFPAQTRLQQLTTALDEVMIVALGDSDKTRCRKGLYTAGRGYGWRAW